MKGDFSRDTFRPGRHFARVLMQQGRVSLDADHNEQSAIAEHALRELTRDLLGPHAAPIERGGFVLQPSASGILTISAGRYYVDGLPIENDQTCTYAGQPDTPLLPTDSLIAESAHPTGRIFCIYLDVWQRHITAVEDEAIRDVALGGADTCTRTRIVWQLKALPLDSVCDADGRTLQARELSAAFLPGSSIALDCQAPLKHLVTVGHSRLAARAAAAPAQGGGYTGSDNHLYRVEIHQPGRAGSATFKWSRDNGSVVTPWLGSSGLDLHVPTAVSFAVGDWVELSHDVIELRGEPGVLAGVREVRNSQLVIDPGSVPSVADITWSAAFGHPKIRKWDHGRSGRGLHGGALPVIEGAGGSPRWIDLEDGIQVHFGDGGEYRSGDYWLIPARSASHQIEWPVRSSSGQGGADILAPAGIEHHYAPLGVASWMGGELRILSCRRVFAPLVRNE